MPVVLGLLADHHRQAINGNSVYQVVSPSGKVHVTVHYAADTLSEEECFPSEA
jgi:hypothetical protein